MQFTGVRQHSLVLLPTASLATLTVMNTHVYTKPRPFFVISGSVYDERVQGLCGVSSDVSRMERGGFRYDLYSVLLPTAHIRNTGAANPNTRVRDCTGSVLAVAGFG